jgi:hypothetical protein
VGEQAQRDFWRRGGTECVAGPPGVELPGNAIVVILSETKDLKAGSAMED